MTVCLTQGTYSWIEAPHQRRLTTVCLALMTVCLTQGTYSRIEAPQQRRLVLTEHQREALREHQAEAAVGGPRKPLSLNFPLSRPSFVPARPLSCPPFVRAHPRRCSRSTSARRSANTKPRPPSEVRWFSRCVHSHEPATFHGGGRSLLRDGGPISYQPRLSASFPWC